MNKMKILFALLAVLVASQISASVIKNKDETINDKGLIMEVIVNTEGSLVQPEAEEETEEAVERLKRESCGPYGCTSGTGGTGGASCGPYGCTSDKGSCGPYGCTSNGSCGPYGCTGK